MFEKIIKKIEDKELIIFGEIHGTKEIPEKISEFFSEYVKENDFDICFEFPEEFQGRIEDFFKEPNPDGRNSLEYFNLIQNIKKLNAKYNREINLFCIDPNAENQEKKEEEVAENILKNLSNKKTFAILGEIHASKNPISFGELKIITAGSILLDKLKDKMFSLRLISTKGKFYNFGEKEIVKDETKDLFNKNFDKILDVGEVSVCSFSKH